VSGSNRTIFTLNLNIARYGLMWSDHKTGENWPRPADPSAHSRAASRNTEENRKPNK